METPTFEVVRAAPASTVRAKREDDGPRMEVRFSAFDNWYEIDSMWEGTFLERVEPGAFAKTITESGRNVKVLFNHGYDPQIGDKVLGTIEDLREDPDAAVGDVRLFDTSYNADLLPGLEAGVYGSSMRMRVTRDEWVDPTEPTSHNPQKLPERTIKEVRLYEFGPVTFPANPESTSKMRSMTDQYYERMRSRDPHAVEELERAVRAKSPTLPNGDAGSSTSPSDSAGNPQPTAPANNGHPEGMTAAQRRRRIHNLKG